MNMNFFVVSARDPTTASCGIILEGTMVLFPFRHVTQKPTAFNLVLSFTLHGWYLGDWTEAHFSPQGQNLQNPGSAWGSKCNLWHFTVFMAPLFLLQEGKRMWRLSSIQVTSIWNDTSKKPKLSPFPVFSTSLPAWAGRTWHETPTFLRMTAALTYSTCRR